MILSALPATQGLYGFVAFLMSMGRDFTTEGPLMLGIGLGVGLVCMISGIRQGQICANGIVGIAQGPVSYTHLGFNPAFYLVGDDVVTKALAVSGARDFGLGTELDYMDDVIRIHEMSDPVEKERKLDLLKWEWLEDRTFFCYFSVERLFAFLIKLDIIERWTHIDKERGGKVFRSLVEQLKNEVEIPQEFKK